MRILAVILIFAVAASALGAAPMPATKVLADEHSCCKTTVPANDKSQQKGEDCGTCHLACCRMITAPAEPLATLVARADLARDLILPPLVANGLAEPVSIFHPPRA